MSDAPDAKKVKELIERADALKKADEFDLSSDQDLSIAIMNLVSIEEHFFFSGAKTGKSKYYDLIEPVREMRKSLLKRIIKEYEGEVWCISKHLLAASYRLMEVGTKALGKGDKQAAYEMFDKAYELYALFWGVQLKMIDMGDVEKIDESALSKEDTKHLLKEAASAVPARSEEKSGGLMSKMKDFVSHAVNCCKE